MGTGEGNDVAQKAAILVVARRRPPCVRLPGVHRERMDDTEQERSQRDYWRARRSTLTGAVLDAPER